MKYCINCGNELGDTKFCTKCGAKAPDDAPQSSGTPQKRFCSNCGAEMGNEQFCTKCGAKATDDFIVKNYSSANNISKTKNNGKGIFAVLMAIVLICAIGFGAFWIFGGRSYESLVKQYVNASMSGDAEKLIKLIPDTLVDYVVTEEFDGDKKKMIDDIKDSLEDYTDMLSQYGIKASDISYEITNVDDMDDDDIEYYEEEFKGTGLKIKEGKELEIDLKIPVNGTERTGSMDLSAVKKGNTWYLIDFGL